MEVPTATEADMILTLTLNPAVDVSLHTDRIVYDDRVYINAERRQPGGKGVNATRVLHGYGAAVHAVATCGGLNGQRFRRLVEQRGLPMTLIEVEGETRRNIAVVDGEGLTLKLDQHGAELSADERERVEAAVLERLAGASWLTLMGSLPPGVPPDYYGRLIGLARQRGVETLLDTGEPALSRALEAGPSLAKPNRPEAERLLERPIVSEHDAAEAAEEIRERGAERVILSLGSGGAVAAFEDGVLRATPPPAEGGSPIGAGDVLGATVIWRLTLGDDFREAFVWGVAAATVAAGRSGLGHGTVEEVERMRESVELRALSGI